MAFFPGQGQGAQAGVVDPFLGIGVQYQQRQADLSQVPSIDAAKLYAQAELQSREYLQAERDKRKPNRMAIMEMAAKRDGTPGEKAAWQKQIIDQLNAYERNFRKDPNYVFSADGVGEYTSLLDAATDPARAEQMRQNANLLETSFQGLQKNNTLDSYQVSGNQILAQDKEGNVAMVPLEQINDGNYVPVTGGDRIAQLRASYRYDAATQSVINMAGGDAARAMLMSAFETASGSESNEQMFQSTVSNRSALNAAKNQAKATMSAEVRDALRADYIKSNPGKKYDEAAFQGYIDKALDQEIAKRLQNKRNIDYASMLRAQAEARKAADEAANSDPFKAPLIQYVQEDKSFIDTEGWNERATVTFTGQSPIGLNPSETTFAEKVFSGEFWTFGGDYNGSAEYKTAKNGSKSIGQLQKVDGKKIENVKLTKRAIMPVTSGEVLTPDFKTDKERVAEESAIVKGIERYRYGDGDNSFVPGNFQVETKTIDIYDKDGKPVFDPNGLPLTRQVDVIQRYDGKFLVVNSTPVNVYETGEGNSYSMFVEPMTPAQSDMAYGKDLSRYYRETDFFTINGNFNLQNGGEVNKLMDALAASDPQTYNQMLAFMKAGNIKDPEVRRILNSKLNEVKRAANNKSNQAIYSTGKPNHTQKDGGYDFIRGANVATP